MTQEKAQESTIKKLIKTALPLTIVAVFAGIHPIYENILLSKVMYGNVPATAMRGYTASFFTIIIPFVIVVVAGFAYLYAKYAAEDDYEKASQLVATYRISIVIISIIVVILSFTLGGVYLQKMGERSNIPQELIDDSIFYMNVYSTVWVLLLISFGQRMILRGEGRTKALAGLPLVGIISSFIWSWLFISVLDLKMVGSAYSLMISISTNVLLITIYLYRLKDKGEYKVDVKKHHYKFDKAIVTTMLLFGLPQLIRVLGDASFYMTSSIYISGLSGDAWAEWYTAFRQGANLIDMFSMGIMSAFAMTYPKMIAAGEKERANKMTYQAIGLVFVARFIAAGVIATFVPTFLKAFGASTEQLYVNSFYIALGAMVLSTVVLATPYILSVNRNMKFSVQSTIIYSLITIIIQTSFYFGFNKSDSIFVWSLLISQTLGSISSMYFVWKNNTIDEEITEGVK